MRSLRLLMSLMVPFVALGALPSSTSYQLNSFGFGNGGSANSSSTNYNSNALTGEVAGSGGSTNYKAGSGENYLKQADVPTLTLVNNASWYNKLLLTVSPNNNPTDAKFAVAISTDGFATTKYVKSDFTVGTTLTITDYQTYAAWGAGAGQYIRGLTHGIVYSAKAKALRGTQTGSAYGPIVTSTTADPSISFEIDISAIDTTTSPPYLINFGTIPVSTVTNSPTKVWISLNTNGESGGKVYISGKNIGLSSASAGYTIAGLTGDLAAAPEGFGLQGLTATQASGGPFSLVAPYNGSAANVGIADNLIRELFTTPAPITAARGSVVLKAKTQPLTPSSSDYTETLTAIASASF
jgi:hypothetical protein